MGIEPTTCSLRVSCATDCAIWAGGKSIGDRFAASTGDSFATGVRPAQPGRALVLGAVVEALQVDQLYVGPPQSTSM